LTASANVAAAGDGCAAATLTSFCDVLLSAALVLGADVAGTLASFCDAPSEVVLEAAAGLASFCGGSGVLELDDA
jgi:hypothetical protein